CCQGQCYGECEGFCKVRNKETCECECPTPNLCEYWPYTEELERFCEKTYVGKCWVQGEYMFFCKNEPTSCKTKADCTCEHPCYDCVEIGDSKEGICVTKGNAVDLVTYKMKAYGFTGTVEPENLTCCEFPGQATTAGLLRDGEDCTVHGCEGECESIRVGNSCCPSGLKPGESGFGFCGVSGICFDADAGVPAVEHFDEIPACCAEDAETADKYHVCSIKAGVGDPKQGSYCCLDEAYPYYNKNSEAVDCCPSPIMSRVALNGNGYLGYHCCQFGRDAVWNGYEAYCCEGGEERVEVVEGKREGTGTEKAYLCCEKGSTAYWEGIGDRRHCCKGEVYRDSVSIIEHYSCCEGATEENPTHVKITNIWGSPSLEETCCPYYEEDGVRKTPEAYWSLGPICCNGTVYVTGTDNYGKPTYDCCAGTPYRNGVDSSGNPVYACCAGATTTNPTHRTVTVLGAPNGEETCCDIATYGTNSTGYWDGSSAQCCAGTPYRNGVDSSGNPIYACCEGATSENPTHKVAETAVGAPNGEGACCDIATYGTNPSAYWTGSSAQCCAGEAKPKLDGSGYVCCPVVETCPDGQEPTDNYVDGVGVCGKVCCPMLEDESSVSYFCIGNSALECEPYLPGGASCLSDEDCSERCCYGDYSRTSRKKEEYVLVGATNGACCGGYTSMWSESLVPHEGSDVAYNYTILNNNGYYCAVSSSGTGFLDDLNSTSERSYLSPSICKITSSWFDEFGGDSETYCMSIKKGDPCDDYDVEEIECPSE
ncbi:MAG: hypothetical protein J6U64_02295, partial [Alphaproteobacteria bacterium]|nr:hypothetical protein [Alphaproteobacteria bacterium]